MYVCFHTEVRTFLILKFNIISDGIVNYFKKMYACLFKFRTQLNYPALLWRVNFRRKKLTQIFFLFNYNTYV